MPTTWRALYSRELLNYLKRNKKRICCWIACCHRKFDLSAKTSLSFKTCIVYVITRPRFFIYSCLPLTFVICFTTRIIKKLFNLCNEVTLSCNQLKGSCLTVFHFPSVAAKKHRGHQAAVLCFMRHQYVFLMHVWSTRSRYYTGKTYQL